jgi:hypothetical protein
MKGIMALHKSRKCLHLNAPLLIVNPHALLFEGINAIMGIYAEDDHCCNALFLVASIAKYPHIPIHKDPITVAPDGLRKQSDESIKDGSFSTLSPLCSVPIS